MKDVATVKLALKSAQVSAYLPIPRVSIHLSLQVKLELIKKQQPALKELQTHVEHLDSLEATDFIQECKERLGDITERWLIKSIRPIKPFYQISQITLSDQ